MPNKLTLLLLILLIALPIALVYFIILHPTNISLPQNFISSLSFVAPPKPSQFVVLSFDGSKDLKMWQATQQFAEEMATASTTVKFTYFVSGVYFLEKDHRLIYQAPREPRGSSLIGFASSSEDVVKRVAAINQAIVSGHEIASHANGHFDGSHWTYNDWVQEIGTFDWLLANINTNNSGVRSDTRVNLPPRAIVGFRAPSLGNNTAMEKALSALRYRYNAGATTNKIIWPWKNEYGIWQFPLYSMRISPESPAFSLLMDYNLFLKQTGARDIIKKNTPAWESTYLETNNAYMKYFNGSYNSNRSPIYISNHFSLWNDGLYWEAMKSFARQVCGRSDIKCVTYKELTDYLDSLPPRVLAAYQAGNFQK
ncbi:MAG: hypothetical protein AAB645_00680 [Patescibacteria group bacterium]